MKKLVIISFAASILIGCGEGNTSETESKEKTCQTSNDVTIDCMLSEDLKKLNNLAFELESMMHLSPENTISAVEKNIEIMQSIDLLLPSLEKALVADPELITETFVIRIFDYKEQLEKYLKSQSDTAIEEVVEM